ncbi:MAG: MJ0144 family RNA dihydrouridine synthase-like protein [Methanobacteriaceae archaeon]
MAGITDGAFCRDISKEGFDMVTLGGYNADPSTIQAGHQILSRGRPEFVVEEEQLLSYLEDQVKLVKKEFKGSVSVNLRSTTPEPIIEISKIKGVDVVEINAHCRQKEITNLGCGQALLQDVMKLEEYVRKIVEKSKSLVSVKIRANVTEINEIDVTKAVERAGANYIHVDAMLPGSDSADLEIIRSIKENTSIFLIGNNSIKDIESARRMLNAGADGISIARAAMGGSLNFDLSQI